MRVTRMLLASLAVIASFANVESAMTQAFPARPMRIVVGYPPGGLSDIVARLIGQSLSERLGQPFVIENRPGAASNIATEAVVHAPADGYTLLLINPANATSATLYDKLNFNFIRDIAPVAGIVRVPNIMEVNPSVPAKTVPEFIAYAKANPGKVNYASAGNGTTVHLAGALFGIMTGVDMVHVPYRGSAPALTDLLGGQVQVMFDTLPSSIEHLRTGKLARPCRNDLDALRSVAGHPNRGRFRTRLRGEPVAGRGRPQEHAARNRREAQPGNQRCSRRSQGEGAACQFGWHGACPLTY